MSSAERVKRAIQIGVTACAAAVMWLAAAGPAFAGPTYTLGGYVGHERGQKADEFGRDSPGGVAIDPASEDVYVVDGGNSRVQEFGSEATPNFLKAWGWKVNEGGAEAFEICTEASSCQQGAAGNGAGELGFEQFPNGGEIGRATGVAVDPVNHDVYVSDSYDHRVEYFEADGKYLHQFNGTEIDGAAAAKPAPEGLSDPSGIAVDAAGQVYVEDPGQDVIDRFSAGGEYECQITGKTPGSGSECDSGGSSSKTAGVAEGLPLGEAATGAGLAVDSSGNVYVANTEDNVVDEFSASGAFVRAFGEGVLSAPQAVAVDNAGDVFALSGGHIVYEFNTAGATIGELPIYTQDGSLEQIDALAVTSNGSRLYAANYSSYTDLLVYGRFAKPTTEPAATPVLGVAVLNGTINPEGLPVEGCQFEWGEGEPGGAFEHSVPCTQTPAEIGSGEAPVAVSAELSGLTPYDLYHYRLVARNGNGATHGADTAMLASVNVFGFQLGGVDALEVNASDPNAEKPTIEENGWQVANPQTPDSQAGSHPFAVTTRFVVNNESDGDLPLGMRPKDYYVNLPAGFAGSVAKVPRCKVSEMEVEFYEEGMPFCPTASQVGVIRIFQPRTGSGRMEEEPLLPVYNMVPPPGVPAELAFSVAGFPVPITIQLRSDSDYGITAEVRNVSDQLEIDGTAMTLWGVPANPAHNRERFLPAFQGNFPGNENGEPLPAGTPEVPFLNNPTKCGAVEEAAIMADSWLHPGKLAEDGRPVPGGENWVTAHTQMYPDGITGCGKLTFEPQIEVTPSTSVADSPMGMTVEIKVPQNENPNNLATPALKNATVTLPQGVSINPAEANGLQGCTPAQIKLHSEAAPECPDASQVGKLELTTPLLPEPLSGQIYLSSEHSGNVFHMFLVIEGQGVLLKLEGSVEANEKTGQVVSTFKENPQLPFSELKLTFYGGSEAALASPQQCGSDTTTSALEPWSQESAEQELGHPVSTPSPFSEFKIDAGCGGGFAPSFSAGTANPAGGSFSPFSLTFSRKDGEQDMSGITLALPPGLTGKLAGVQECANAQIEAAEHASGAAEQVNPSCPAGSELGTVETGAGPGEKPFFLGGKIYLTGPYKGAPFGLVEIVPVLAGPYDLGTVVVRQTINVDPHTAQVTVTSDPFPTIIDGIPLRLRTVHVSIDRPDFMLNPTSCEAMHVAGTIVSTTGSDATESSRLQVGDCGSLPFKSKFEASTQGATSKKDGASLTVHVSSSTGQANIAKVHVSLPKQLPSRLETLKLACTEGQFAANPAGCPAGSRVGNATASTPLLSAPLSGPAYIVSHGGAAFPDVEIVLQGEGITLVLDGKTNINEMTGITTSSFETVPDVPVSSFELKLPEQSNSILAAPGGNLCSQSLVMPTTITGQNGAVIEQATKISVSGCKPQVRVLSHKVENGVATVVVSVPSPGKLIASGKGITRASKTAAKAKSVTLKLSLTRTERSFLKRHPGRRLKAAVKLRFTPTHGQVLSAGVSVLIR